ncbi:MAG TPA: MoaD/ThiS family protein [Chthoniobacterales bacterium]|jgi:Molybdopterin converting factor, small subunit|nr:MoaD/ThiS family protein [Chthoniobacterales bacterium]
MKVRVQFFSRLRDVTGSEHCDLDLKTGAMVSDLLAELFARFPKLRDWERSILVGAGVEFVERGYVLRADEEISIMPPVQGG